MVNRSASWQVCWVVAALLAAVTLVSCQVFRPGGAQASGGQAAGEQKAGPADSMETVVDASGHVHVFRRQSSGRTSTSASVSSTHPPISPSTSLSSPAAPSASSASAMLSKPDAEAGADDGVHSAYAGEEYVDVDALISGRALPRGERGWEASFRDVSGAYSLVPIRGGAVTPLQAQQEKVVMSERMALALNELTFLLPVPSASRVMKGHKTFFFRGHWLPDVLAVREQPLALVMTEAMPKGRSCSSVQLTSHVRKGGMVWPLLLQWQGASLLAADLPLAAEQQAGQWNRSEQFVFDIPCAQGVSRFSVAAVTDQVLALWVDDAVRQRLQLPGNLQRRESGEMTLVWRE